MSAPRFLFLATVATGHPARSRVTTNHLWRLVAGNNHVLGCAPHAYEDEDACRAAVLLVVEQVGRAVVQTSVEGRPGRWRWRLLVPEAREGRAGQLLAVSARGYERQRESRYNVEGFLAAVPLAAVAPTVVVRPRPRTLSRSGPSLPPGVVPSQPEGNGFARL